MGFRRKREEVTTQHKWIQFVSDHVNSFRNLGLPEMVSDDHEYWRDVVYHGYPEQHQQNGPSIIPSCDFTNADSSKMAEFVRLLELYFEAGFAYLDPEFLKWLDRKAYDRIVERHAA